MTLFTVNFVCLYCVNLCAILYWTVCMYVCIYVYVYMCVCVCVYIVCYVLLVCM